MLWQNQYWISRAEILYHKYLNSEIKLLRLQEALKEVKDIKANMEHRLDVKEWKTTLENGSL
ncbi:CLUMA_CG017804, isoform A [Clunio marinus]|uniref:CLUMA_CG017804, isoform A n=1 Tax=Clunio marinus TaxID=568069 RepID=A0A1J1IXB7_9DIPT|nr:CLUMA_CG017804, isoform A [Clunio marinus]